MFRGRCRARVRGWERLSPKRGPRPVDTPPSTPSFCLILLHRMPRGRVLTGVSPVPGRQAREWAQFLICSPSYPQRPAPSRGSAAGAAEREQRPRRPVASGLRALCPGARPTRPPSGSWGWGQGEATERSGAGGKPASQDTPCRRPHTAREERPQEGLGRGGGAGGVGGSGQSRGSRRRCGTRARQPASGSAAPSSPDFCF